MSTILVIDDEEGIRSVLSDILEDEGYEVMTAEDGIVGLQVINENRVDLVFLDVWLPNMGGIDVLERIREQYPDVSVVIISGHGNIDLAVKAVKLGAFDFLEKPLSLEKVLTLARNALQMKELRRENRRLKQVDSMRMLGESKPIRDIRKLIEQSAASDARVLIIGENGTGKELVAREIHQKSERSDGPFIEVNCAAIPDNLIESELFGHEKGSFTGASAQRRGKFEIADGGTLFLDEVADMSLNAQAKVLRAIQEMRFMRIGGEESIHVDVRIVAATNKDIQEAIAAKEFREDLYYRLAVVPIDVPPLRDRGTDVLIMLEHFCHDYAENVGRPVKQFSEDARKLLSEYDWPGNVRELKNFAERITIMSDSETVDAEELLSYLGKSTGDEQSPIDEFMALGLTEAKDRFEKQYLERKLAENDYNISRTAGELGIYPSNLHQKMRKFGIQREDSK